MDPHNFAEPDPGSQKLVDPTDPDPKHRQKLSWGGFEKKNFRNLKTNLTRPSFARGKKLSDFIFYLFGSVLPITK